MRRFTCVVERRCFTLAAEDLALPRSTVTDAVKQLEARLGVRLLQRTTRHVSPTLDGEAYHRRCLALIADLEDAEAAFGGAKPKALLRVDVHGTLARHFVLPHLSDFLAEYPGIQVYMSEGDRLVDLVCEGIDCVVRVGDLHDSDMIGVAWECWRRYPAPHSPTLNASACQQTSTRSPAIAWCASTLRQRGHCCRSNSRSTASCAM